MSLRQPVVFLLAIISMILPLSLQAAQVSAVPFAGIVVDPAGAPVSRAHVTLIPVDGTAGPSVSAETDGGRFALQVQPGTYVVQVEMKNFTALTERVDVAKGDTVVRRFELQVAGAHDSITVFPPRSYTVPAISATNASSSTSPISASVVAPSPNQMPRGSPDWR